MQLILGNSQLGGYLVGAAPPSWAKSAAAYFDFASQRYYNGGTSYGGVPSGMTYTNSTGGSYFNSAGVLKYAAVNLFTYSEQFDNAAWTKSGGAVASPIVTANQAIAPDGTMTADKVTFPDTNTASCYSILYQRPSAASSG